MRQCRPAPFSDAFHFTEEPSRVEQEPDADREHADDRRCRSGVRMPFGQGCAASRGADHDNANLKSTKHLCRYGAGPVRLRRADHANGDRRSCARLTAHQSSSCATRPDAGKKKARLPTRMSDKAARSMPVLSDRDQHAPDEHLLSDVAEQGVRIMVGLLSDLPRRPLKVD
jgi:hypothetical protein